MLSNHISWAGADWLLLLGYSMRNYTCNKSQIFYLKEGLKIFDQNRKCQFFYFFNVFFIPEKDLFIPNILSNNISWPILWKITHAINFKFLTNNNPSAKMEMFSTFEGRFLTLERLVFFSKTLSNSI